MTELTTILSIAILLAMMSLTLIIYVLTMALRNVIAKNHSLTSQIMTFKVHQQSGPLAADQVLRSQKLTGLAETNAPKQPPRPKEKPPEPFIVKSSFNG